MKYFKVQNNKQTNRKTKTCEPKILYPAGLSVKNDKEIGYLKGNTKQFITTKPALQKFLKEILHKEEDEGEPPQESMKVYTP